MECYIIFTSVKEDMKRKLQGYVLHHSVLSKGTNTPFHFPVQNKHVCFSFFLIEEEEELKDKIATVTCREGVLHIDTGLLLSIQLSIHYFFVFVLNQIKRIMLVEKGAFWNLFPNWRRT